MYKHGSNKRYAVHSTVIYVGIGNLAFAPKPIMALNWGDSIVVVPKPPFRSNAMPNRFTCEGISKNTL